MSVRERVPSPDRLFHANARLVPAVLSRRFPTLSPDAREEATGPALLGLWRAACAYDPQRGQAFSTLAALCITRAVLDHRVHQARQQRLPCVPLDTPVEGTELTLADALPDDREEAPGARLVSDAGFALLLSPLPVRQKALLRAVYGQGRTLADVAAVRGVSSTAVASQHRAALRQLRTGAEKAGKKGQR